MSAFYWYCLGWWLICGIAILIRAPFLAVIPAFALLVLWYFIEGHRHDQRRKEKK